MNGGIKNIEVNYIEPLARDSNIEFVIYYPDYIERIRYCVLKDHLLKCYHLYMRNSLVEVNGALVDHIGIIRNSYIFDVLGIDLCNFSKLLLGYYVLPSTITIRNVNELRKILQGLKHYNEF